MPQFEGPEESSKENGLESLEVPREVKVIRTSLGPLGDQVAKSLGGEIATLDADTVRELVSVTLDSWKPIEDQVSSTLGVGTGVQCSYPEGVDLISNGTSCYSLHTFQDANDPRRFVLPNFRPLDRTYPDLGIEKPGEVLISRDGTAPVIIVREVKESQDGIGALEVSAGARFAANKETTMQLCLNFQQSFDPESNTSSYVREIIERRLVDELRKVIRDQIKERTDTSASHGGAPRIEDLKRRRPARPAEAKGVPAESALLSDLIARGYATLRVEAPDMPRIYDEIAYYAPLPPEDVYNPLPEPDRFERWEYTLGIDSQGAPVVKTETTPAP